MNKTLRTVVLAAALLLFFVTGCAADRAPPPSSGAPPAAAADANALPSAGRALVVTIDIGLTVSNVDAAVASIRDESERSGGFVADLGTRAKDDAKTAHLDLRIPADKVRALRSALRAMGEVTTDNEKVEDVTEQRADTEARLRNARVQEKRILELLGQKTSSIAEILEAEKELARVRETVERLDAQDRALKSRIAMATVRVQLEAHPTPAWQTPLVSIGRASKVGLRGAASLVVYFTMALAAVGPSLVPIAAVVFVAAYVVRRRRRSAAG